MIDGNKSTNPYAAFFYPQRFLTAVLSGVYLSLWISIVLLLIGIVYLAPTLSLPWKLAIIGCQYLTTPVNGTALFTKCIWEKGINYLKSFYSSLLDTFITVAQFGDSFTNFIYIGSPIFSFLFMTLNAILMFKEYKSNVNFFYCQFLLVADTEHEKREISVQKEEVFYFCSI